uniref:Uncharacterized protein n=1 Tax=Aegilops tauschii subsp. strangulata TaxID=200361 RepID=A0A453DNM2_AEGTS
DNTGSAYFKSVPSSRFLAASKITDLLSKKTACFLRSTMDVILQGGQADRGQESGGRRARVQPPLHQDPSNQLWNP